MSPEILDAIEAVLRQAPAGMAFDDLANAFDPPANSTDLHVWLQALGDQRRVMFYREHGRMFAMPASVSAAADNNSTVTATEPGSGPESGDSADPDRTVAGNAATQPQFAAVFDDCVLPIVGGLMPRASTTACLQTQARLFFSTQEDRARFLAYALAEIEALVPASAAQYGLTAEQVAAWRAIYDADRSECRAGALPRQARDAELVERANPTVVEDRSNGHAATVPPVDSPADAAPKSAEAASRGRPGRPVSAGGNSGRVGVIGGVSAPVRALDLQREMQAAATDVARDMAREIATTWDLQAAIKRAGGAMKATLTPGRGLLAVVWACAVFWAVQYYLKTAALHATATSAQRAALLGQVVGLGTVPLCGVPWLGFRWWDLRTREGLTAIDVVVTLCVGGVLGLMLANVVVSLGSCVGGLIPG